jgi:tRNA(fMet)-specific endonuclease VapC
MALFLLDTTTLTHLRNGNPRAHDHYLMHTSPNSVHTVAVASVNVEEVMGGWLNYLKQAKTVVDEVNGSRYLNDAIRELSRFVLCNMTEAAVNRYDTLRRMKLNVGRNDLRLAALALELNATVVTDNIRDFGRVPGLSWVDWTK